jgi:enoyl-CoA hydratase/carnithine racemase
MTNSEPSVLSRLDGRVGWITLNRPKAYNAITTDLAQALEQALLDLAGEAHVIVVRGAGGNFSVGGDFKEVERLRAAGSEAMAELFESFARACLVIADVAAPVIAAVEGYAMAGGFELMQACDFAIVRDDARIGDNHSNFGQVPGGGSSQRLPRLVGRQRALGLILTGDHITGTQAEAWGLAYRAVPPAEFDVAVADLAERLATKSSAALARAKKLVYAGFELPLASGIALEIETVLEHLGETDAAEGMERFERRRARGGA